MNNSLLSVNQVAPSETVAPKAMRFESLQIFRGLAAVSVVLYHAMCYTRDELGATPLLNWLIPGGSGVDFFFVLSGFIIATAHQKDLGQPGRLGSFAYKRFVRIYPLYFIFTALMLFRAVAHLGRHVPVYGADVILKSFLLLPQRPGVNPIVVPGWTLVYEALFYGLFAALIYFSPRVTVWICSVLLAFTVYSFVFPIPGPYWLHTWLFSPYNLEFAAGCGASVLAKRRVGWMLPLGVAALIVGWAITATQTVGISPGSPGLTVLRFGVPYWLIVTGAASVEYSGRILKGSGFLVRLGDATYSIYLAHFFFAAVLAKAVCDRFHKVSPEIIVIFVATVAVAFGYLVHVTVEQPLLNRLRRRERSTSKLSAPPAVAASIDVSQVSIS